MNDYYIKITQRDAQIEFSTSDKAEFGLRLAELMRLAGALEREPQVVDSLLEQKKSTQDIDVASKLLETKQQTTKNKIEHSSDTTKTTQDNKNAFENILKKEMKNPQEQVSPNFGLDKKYATILAAKDISGDLDSLIFTAGYLILYEKLSSFTLKDINRKLFPVTKQAIGHYEMNEAIEKGFIEVVPNPDDARALTRYCLTYEGEGFYNVLIK